MAKKVEVSEAGSIKGFSLKKWLLDDLAKLLKNHKPAIKIVAGAVVSIAVLYPESAAIIAMLGGATYVTTRVLSFLDFYFSRVELE